MINGGIKE